MTNKRRRLVGMVTRTNAEKTVTVRIDRSSRHPLYGKVIRTNKNYLVHDELGCHIGDQVKMIESRPISKRKRWVVEEILQRKSELEASESAVQTEDEVDVEAEA